jgi:hypothetical protein
VALPESGREALRRLDLDAHFTSSLLRRGAAHLREHLTDPTEGIPQEDPELASLVAELVLRADRVPAGAAALRVQALQLEKARLERAIAAARQEAPAQVSDLAVRLSGVKDQLDVAMDDAMAGRAGG